ncbi:MAG: NAD-dependent DNA ligase LigA [Lachnospiraceae bacterium]|nr:NAD-dependent DNA ligase LigA [Lachnospiraceae bacterium]
MEEKLNRIKELVSFLNEAGKAYYQESREIISNFEYDALYDELVSLEQETGIIMANSPTVNVGYEVLSELPKETHEKPMLSLDKTKEVEGLKSFLNDKEGLLSWKLDGLTVVLTYEDGKLVKAFTRGNGEVGEVITGNAKTFKNLPLNIAYKGQLILRGEAIIKYSDFEVINNQIEDEALKYKNPRNLCAGSVRQLNNRITAERNVNFFAFSLVKADDAEFNNSIEEQYKFLENLGFNVVEYRRVNSENVEENVKYFAKEIEDNDCPSDGLVLVYDDIAYGKSLGQTAKFPRNGIAFKWADELATTHLLEIEWSPSRTGLINPVAIFEPVELEGTTVSRASVHNISIMEGLELGIGDEIEVYKANMIIPQIAANHTRSGNVVIPCECPACGGSTEIKQVGDVKSLYCINEDCIAKRIKKMSHFVSRDAMNIDGLSEETLDKFIDSGYIREYADIYRINRYEEQIVNTKGFGRKSYDKLINAINEKRVVKMPNFIFSLGIPGIGLANAKAICKHFGYDFESLRSATTEELSMIDGVGEVLALAVTGYFANQIHLQHIDELLKEVSFENIEENTNELTLDGKVFVITGSVYNYANRNELKDYIESLGGKVTGSVTAKTDYLINNDITSNSSKNKKAKELGVSIINEEMFDKLAKGEQE